MGSSGGYLRMARAHGIDRTSMKPRNYANPIDPVPAYEK